MDDEPAIESEMAVGVDADPPLIALLRAYRYSTGGETVLRGIVNNVLEGRPWDGGLEAWLCGRGAGPVVAGSGRRTRGWAIVTPQIIRRGAR